MHYTLVRADVYKQTSPQEGPVSSDGILLESPANSFLLKEDGDFLLLE